MNKGGWEDPLIWGKDGEQALPILLQSWTVCMIRNLLVTDPGISYNCVWFLSRLLLSCSIFPNLLILYPFLAYLVLRCLLYHDTHLFPSPAYTLGLAVC